MHQTDDFDRFSSDPINQNIVWVDDNFACARNPADPIHEGMIGEAFGAGLDRQLQAISRCHVAFGDV